MPKGVNMAKATTEKYCILGGGAMGIGIAKCFTQAEIPFDIYEREDDFGGNWYFDQACSKMYKSTHLISSKTNTQFSDIPMPKEFPPYPNHIQMLQYLRYIANHFKLYDHTYFNTEILKLEPVSEFWRVSLKNGEDRLYKGVIVCNGLLRQKKMPNYQGQFSGEQIHSVDYKSIDQIHDKKVLVVGAGNSGCDIAVDAVHTAAKVFHSTRRGYHYMPKFIDGMPTQEWLMELAHKFHDQASYWKHVREVFKLAGFDGTDYGLPSPDHDIYQAHPIMNSLVLYYIGHGDVTPKPDIKEMKSSSVVFEDDSEETVDMIIYATGYVMSFPFISKENLLMKGNLPNLYAHMFHKRYENILFCGYVNAPGGIGNMANSMGRLAVAYFKALDRGAKSVRLFRRLKQEHEPDLGHKVYMHSERHAYEVDLWQYIKFLNSLRAKFEDDL